MLWHQEWQNSAQLGTRYGHACRCSQGSVCRGWKIIRWLLHPPCWMPSRRRSDPPVAPGTEICGCLLLLHLDPVIGAISWACVWSKTMSTALNPMLCSLYRPPSGGSSESGAGYVVPSPRQELPEGVLEKEGRRVFEVRTPRWLELPPRDIG